MMWLLPGGFSTRLAYAYLDAEYDDYIGTGGQDFSGNPLPVSPEHHRDVLSGLPGEFFRQLAVDRRNGLDLGR